MDITPGEGRWLTYRQIADLRGISKASAERLVRRHRWRRQEGIVTLSLGGRVDRAEVGSHGLCCRMGASILLPIVECLGADRTIDSGGKSVTTWTKMAIDE